MMQEIDFEQVVAAPAPKVWSFVSDHQRLNRWLVPGAKVSMRRLGEPDPNGLGAIRVLGGLGIYAHEEIVAFEPGRLAYTVIKGVPVRNHRGELSVESTDGGSKVRWRIRFEPTIPGTGRITRAMVAWLIRSGLHRLSRLTL